MNINGIQFEPEQKDCYFWFGKTHDACLESTDGYIWHLWIHQKDGSVVTKFEGTSKDTIVRHAQGRGYFTNGEVG